jgi:5-methylcytosine-specific restriction endonuclease McrA
MTIKKEWLYNETKVMHDLLDQGDPVADVAKQLCRTIPEIKARMQVSKYKRKPGASTKPRKRPLSFSGNMFPAFERDAYTCQHCGKSGKIGEVNLHRIDFSDTETEFPNDTLENLETVCHTCHGSVHATRRHELWKQQDLKDIAEGKPSARAGRPPLNAYAIARFKDKLEAGEDQVDDLAEMFGRSTEEVEEMIGIYRRRPICITPDCKKRVAYKSITPLCSSCAAKRRAQEKQDTADKINQNIREREIVGNAWENLPGESKKDALKRRMGLKNTKDKYDE